MTNNIASKTSVRNPNGLNVKIDVKKPADLFRPPADYSPSVNTSFVQIVKPNIDFSPYWEGLRLRRALNSGECTILDEALAAGKMLDPRLPPLSNTGGTLYREYEYKQETIEKADVMVDTLSLTGRFDVMPCPVRVFTDIDRINYVSKVLGETFGVQMSGEIRAGRNFYKNLMKLQYTDNRPSKDLGFVAWGGNRGTFQLYLTGECMAYLNACFSSKLLHHFAEQFGFKISRIDLSHDDLEGKCGIADALAMHAAGGFMPFGGGKNPRLRQVGDFVSAEDPEGRTVYIGSRQSDKLLRVYEKGKQQGAKDSKWTRWEIEYHANDRELSLDMIANPQNYFAGAYPALVNFVVASVQHVKTVLKQKAKATIERAKSNIKKQYGRYLWVLRELQGDSFLDDVQIEGEIPKGLILPLNVRSEASTEPPIDTGIFKSDGLLFA